VFENDKSSQPAREAIQVGLKTNHFLSVTTCKWHIQSYVLTAPHFIHFVLQRLPEEIKIKHEKLKEEMIGKFEQTFLNSLICGLLSNSCTSRFPN
jgi:hypothetical protein